MISKNICKKSCCINKGVNKCSMAFFIIGIYIYIVYSFLRQQNPYSECLHARMACILVCAIVRTHACMYVYTGDYQLCADFPITQPNDFGGSTACPMNCPPSPSKW